MYYTCYFYSDLLLLKPWQEYHQYPQNIPHYLIIYCQLNNGNNLINYYFMGDSIVILPLLMTIEQIIIPPKDKKK